WMVASIKTAENYKRSTHMTKQLHAWVRSFIINRDDLLFNLYSSWSVSMLKNRDLVNAIHEHLMGISKYVSAVAVVYFINSTEIKKQYSLQEKNILLAMAQRWMCMVGYHWQKSPTS
ncbi:hypothetical protein HETIRDRAFT_322919, partial [Heterobasidion irregulare TC 32-1]